MIRSPCIKHCNINKNHFCSGCGRKIQEIQEWTRLKDEQKLEILELSRSRLKNKLDKNDR